MQRKEADPSKERPADRPRKPQRQQRPAPKDRIPPAKPAVHHDTLAATGMDQEPTG
jgi:hypothetical protein